MRFAPVVAPRPHPAVVEAELAGTLVLFHLADRRLHVLNETAAAIWGALGRAATIGEITVALGDRFLVDPQSIRSDVEHTLGQLRADGLVTVQDHVRAAVASPERTARPDGAVDAPPCGSYAALDARIALSCDDDEIVEQLARVLAPLHCAEEPTTGLAITRESEHAWSIRVGDTAAVSVGSRLAVVLRALGEVNNVAVASCPADLVFHAGAVGDRDGVVLLPGGSNHGKSTLTTALVGSGLGYLTDEAAAVTARLEVRPFAKSIALDPGSFPLFAHLAPPATDDGLGRALDSREWHLPPSRVGSLGAQGPVRVVVCPQWRPGSATRLHRSEPTEALHRLIGQCFDFRLGGQRVFERLVALVGRVPVYRLGYSDLDEAVEIVTRLREEPERPPI